MDKVTSVRYRLYVTLQNYFYLEGYKNTVTGV